MYTQKLHNSPLGEITIAADNMGIVGLWLPGQPAAKLSKRDESDTLQALEHLKEASEWLDRYFAGEKPDPETLKLNPQGTEFQRQVWSILMEIPYGETASYREIADEVAKVRGKERMSSRAVGAANGHNPISIIVPCHRVIGSNKHLTGYGGGLPLKRWLLEHEGLKIVNYRIVVP